MSTKSTICHGEGYHLYHDMQELMDGEYETVFLRLENVDFEAYPSSVTVAIPVEIWNEIKGKP